MNNDAELSLLRNLIGEQLSSVTFVQDYVQLSFDGPSLTLYNWPVVIVNDQAILQNEHNYKDALCAQIGIQVASVILTPQNFLALLFENKVTLQVLLREEAYVTAEAVLFQSDQGWWVI